jgi:lysozyme family protein
MLNRPSEIEVDDFNNFVNRPKTLEVDSNEFDSFLGKKAKARRQAKKDAKNGVSTDPLTPVDPAIAGALPTADFGKKPKPATSPNPNAPTAGGEGTTKTTDTTDTETSTTGLSKGLMIGLAVVALGAGYWFFVRKKK